MRIWLWILQISAQPIMNDGYFSIATIQSPTTPAVSFKIDFDRDIYLVKKDDLGSKIRISDISLTKVNEFIYLPEITIRGQDIFTIECDGQKLPTRIEVDSVPPMVMMVPPSSEPALDLVTFMEHGTNMFPKLVANRLAFVYLGDHGGNFDAETTCRVEFSSTGAYKLTDFDGDDLVSTLLLKQQPSSCRYNDINDLLDYYSKINDASSQIKSVEQLRGLSKLLSLFEHHSTLVACDKLLLSNITTLKADPVYSLSKECLYDKKDENWQTDPCCNLSLRAKSCCNNRPQKYDNLIQITSVSILDTCRNQDLIRNLLASYQHASLNHFAPDWDWDGEFIRLFGPVKYCFDVLFDTGCSKDQDCVYSGKCGVDGKCVVDYFNPSVALSRCFFETLDEPLLFELSNKLGLSGKEATVERFANELFQKTKGEDCFGLDSAAFKQSGEVKIDEFGNFKHYMRGGDQVRCTLPKKCSLEPWVRTLPKQCVGKNNQTSYCARCIGMHCEPLLDIETKEDCLRCGGLDCISPKGKCSLDCTDCDKSESNCVSKEYCSDNDFINGPLCLSIPTIPFNCGDLQSTKNGNCIQQSVKTREECIAPNVWQSKANFEYDCKNLAMDCYFTDGYARLSKTECTICGGVSSRAFEWKKPTWSPPLVQQEFKWIPVELKPINQWTVGMQYYNVKTLIAESIATILTSRMMKEFSKAYNVKFRILENVGKYCMNSSTESPPVQPIIVPLTECRLNPVFPTTCLGLTVDPQNLNPFEIKTLIVGSALVTPLFLFGSSEVVLNKDSIPIGQIIGDGKAFKFSSPVEGTVQICLELNSFFNNNQEKYPVLDFVMWREDGLSFPVGAVVKEVGWKICAQVEGFQEGVFIPIRRIDVFFPPVTTTSASSISTELPITSITNSATVVSNASVTAIYGSLTSTNVNPVVTTSLTGPTTIAKPSKDPIIIDDRPNATRIWRRARITVSPLVASAQSSITLSPAAILLTVILYIL